MDKTFKKLGLTQQYSVIDYNQFLAACQDQLNAVNEKTLKATFDLFDKNGDGKLSLEEMRSAMPKFLPGKWEEFIQDVDDDGDGLISYREYKDQLGKFCQDQATES